jgi:hypothetical protein
MFRLILKDHDNNVVYGRDMNPVPQCRGSGLRFVPYLYISALRIIGTCGDALLRLRALQAVSIVAFAFLCSM